MKDSIKCKFLGKVSHENLDFFRQNGYIHFESFLSPKIVDRIRSLVDLSRAYVSSQCMKNIKGIPILYGRIGERNLVHRLPFTSFIQPEIETLMIDEGIGNLTELLPSESSRLGFRERDGLVSNFYINENGSRYKQMGWHKDVVRENLLGFKRCSMLNVGIYLTESNRVNGGLRVLPCSHINRNVSKMMMLDKRADEKEILINACKGDVVIHDGELWHRVAKATITGVDSIREVLYVPIICGNQKERDAYSGRPLYHYFSQLINYR